MDIFLKLYAPDFKYYFPSNNPTPLTREDEIAMARAMFAAIPDFVHEITDIIAVKDRVVLRFVAKGTHKRELEGTPPTGNKVANSAICIFRIKDGLVIEEIGIHNHPIASEHLPARSIWNKLIVCFSIMDIILFIDFI